MTRAEDREPSIKDLLRQVLKNQMELLCVVAAVASGRPDPAAANKGVLSKLVDTRRLLREIE